ncbi:DNA replication/repair protein RecF [Microbulbifer sp. SA54]|uniref:DNA replication/repair protein RecF n=1 Tax=Microbulbifer sp. SA54 TaxID=3401577 RepID=UPI003AB085DB
MSLRRLAISRFRNIVAADLRFPAEVNLFVGVNGSGKTSILEAIHMLGTGRSFRSRQSQSVIQYDQEALAVFGKLDNATSLGVEKLRDGKGRIRINHNPAESSSQLAACLPLQVINSESFAALDGGPAVRRQLLDWTVFHVEHRFAMHWKAYQIALRQRNALLRRGKIDGNLMAPWELQLIQSSVLVDTLRQQVFESLRQHFFRRVESLPQRVFGALELHYRSGWKKGVAFEEALAASRESDAEHGFTRVGPHRADLRFSVNGQAADAVLSRGQQKMLVCALRTAMAGVIGVNAPPVFLVDDLPSELDEENQRLFAHWVSECADQVFVTGIDGKATAQPWLSLSKPWNRPTMFHVEHGQIDPVEQNF